ncbi:MAG TPA: hypothetical protein VJG30_00195 [Candidatus Nanoarchaeia archaeon]|nr:hypothetical protein [Candidatus Nanoarchaeia archaeon]
MKKRTVMAKKVNKNYFKTAVYIIIILLILGLAYSVYVFKKGVGEEGENFIVCQSPDNCVAAMHIHAEVYIDVCGKQLDLPLEAGDKTGTHTHKERNLLHFEERLKYDNKMKSIIETDPIKLKSFFQHEDVNIRLNSNCINGKCNGDLCNDNTGSLKMFVNGVENFEFENYVWKDGDKIKIVFE